MINKDITHPRMRRNIKNPRIVLLDCSLEYKKGESQVCWLARLRFVRSGPRTFKYVLATMWSRSLLCTLIGEGCPGVG